MGIELPLNIENRNVINLSFGNGKLFHGVRDGRVNKRLSFDDCMLNRSLDNDSYEEYSQEDAKKCRNTRGTEKNSLEK